MLHLQYYVCILVRPAEEHQNTYNLTNIAHLLYENIILLVGLSVCFFK